jgi:hypothetical protein
LKILSKNNLLRKALLYSILITVFLFSVDSVSANDEIYKLIKISNIQKSDIGYFAGELGLDISAQTFGPNGITIEVVANKSEFNQIENSGYAYEVIIDDLERYYANQYVGLTMGGFRTYSEIKAKLDSLELEYPQFAKVDSIGYSHEGNAVWAMKVSDNVEIEEDEPEVLFTGILHAREPIGSAICLDFAEWLCSQYGENSIATDIMDNRQVWIVPCVNPDGYLYNEMTNPNGGGMWRKNRRDNGGGVYGVDLNRNFPYQWGFDNNGSSPDPSGSTYRGPSPGSEPEAQAIIQLYTEHDFKFAIHYHGGAELVITAWGYTNLLTPHQHLYRAFGDTLSFYTGYPTGATWQVLYYSNGSAYDYCYGDTVDHNRIYGFTCEAGDRWPSPSTIPVLVSVHRNYCITLSQLADNIYRSIAPTGPIVDEMTVDDDGDFIVSWDMAVADTIPDQYELQEVSDMSIVTDGAEDGDGNWILDGFSTSSSQHNSGSYSFFGGNSNNRHATMTLASPLRVTEGMSLTYYTYYLIESDYDYGFCEISTDGFHFEILETYTGNSGGWQQKTFSLNSYVGQDVYLRFRYETDIGYTQTGFFVDDIQPIEAYGIVVSLDDNIMEPEFNVTGRTAGIYNYRVRAMNTSGWGVFGNVEDIEVLEGGCVYTVGDINNSGNLNGLDVTYAVVYFKGGPPPPYECECTPGNTWHVGGDVNNSCAFNGLDVTYLVNYFKGGNTPTPCADCPPAG